MDVMDKFPDIFKDNYLIMDNAPIHMNEDIKSFIEGRGYRYVYLPPYSPELYPIEQFWSVCKQTCIYFLAIVLCFVIYNDKQLVFGRTANHSISTKNLACYA